MKINRVYNASIRTAHDIKFLYTHKRSNLEAIDKRYYDTLVRISGEPSKNPKQLFNNLRSAYRHNVGIVKMIEEINKPFKKPSFIRKLLIR